MPNDRVPFVGLLLFNIIARWKDDGLDLWTRDEDEAEGIHRLRLPGSGLVSYVASSACRRSDFGVQYRLVPSYD